ncbi:ABC-three component system middle component 6 [Arachnia rubra]|uniref:ABC-three component system middle component 6 n=1 Tax=Arachnia rubra TaxID=1547448 RepID=UPI0037BFB3B5
MPSRHTSLIHVIFSKNRLSSTIGMSCTMLLPTKGIEPQRALLTVGANIISLLDSPATVSGLWERFSKSSGEASGDAKITFDWFAFALSMLFAINAVSWNKSGQLVRSDVSA